MECEVKRGHRRLVFAAVCLGHARRGGPDGDASGLLAEPAYGRHRSGTAAEQNVGEASSDDAAAGQPVN